VLLAVIGTPNQHELKRTVNLVVGEAFKLIEGKIMMIQAVMANQPAKAWDSK
jgi:hypothetical protein